MAEEGTFTTNAEVLRKAGIDVSATAEAYSNQFIKEAEGEICVLARQDFVANYSSLNTRGQELLRSMASDMAAIKIINYSMRGITEATSRAEAEDRVNILRDSFTRGEGILLDKKAQKFITG